jgi:hypothetical protein
MRACATYNLNLDQLLHFVLDGEGLDRSSSGQTPESILTRLTSPVALQFRWGKTHSSSFYHLLRMMLMAVKASSQTSKAGQLPI